jgi:hypothetical protein
MSSFSEILAHPWMKGYYPDKQDIIAEFERRHQEVKANADAEKMQKEMEREQMAANRGASGQAYRSVADFAKYEGTPLKKQIK